MSIITNTYTILILNFKILMSGSIVNVLLGQQIGLHHITYDILIQTLQHIFISLIIGPLFYTFFDNYNIWGINYSFYSLIYNNIKYILLLELFQYTVHYYLHTKRFYWIHRKHHEASLQLYPIHTAVVDYIEAIWVVSLFHIPMFFATLSKSNLEFVVLCLSSYQFFQHSQEFCGLHYLHHVYYKCNYCFIFPVFDYIFGTYRHKRLFSSSNVN